MSDPQKIQPRPTAVSEPYWAGCREGELRLQNCQSCRSTQFYPRLMCASCGSRDLAWVTASGVGRIASFTVVRRGVSAAYEAPYVVALVDLAEGPRMMSQISNCDADDPRLEIGAAVEVEFREWSSDVTMPVFRLSDPRV